MKHITNYKPKDFAELLNVSVNRLQKAYKVELKPTKQQMQKINQSLGVCRWLYNAYLAKNQSLYQDFKDGKLDEITGDAIYYDLGSMATGITDLATIEKVVKESGMAKWEEIKSEIEDVKSKIISGEIDVTNAQIGEEINYASLTHLSAADE